MSQGLGGETMPISLNQESKDEYMHVHILFQHHWGSHIWFISPILQMEKLRFGVSRKASMQNQVYNIKVNPRLAQMVPKLMEVNKTKTP